MKLNILEWLAEVSALPLVTEQEGALRLNSIAKERFGGLHQQNLTDLIRQMAPTAEPGELEEFVSVGSKGHHALSHSGGIVISVVEDSTRRVLGLSAPSDEGLAAKVSHELANAFGGILGWVDLARRVPSDHVRALRRIEASARSAEASARHMLESARGATPTQERINLARLAREVTELLEPLAGEAGVHLNVRAPDKGTRVLASRAQLYSALWNLVQNAIEALPAGGTVNVDVASSPEGSVFSVSDDGPGIPEAQRDQVFENYFTTKTHGTGLGLPLVRKAVESSGGTLSLSDAPEGGARFVVSLPEHPVPSIRPPNRPASGIHEAATLAGRRILVVDDDFAIRDLLSTTLHLAGANVTACRGGAEALNVDGEYDLALIDWRLNDMRGDEIISRLRNKGIVTKVALVSGSTVPPDLDAAGRPDTWIRKPFDLGRLIKEATDLIGHNDEATEKAYGKVMG